MYRLPLATYRVLDLGPTAAAAYAARLLGDAGAEVIAVERGTTARSPLFRQLNRNKLGCTLDFATPRGAALLQRLVARCDVVVEGFDAPERERLGLTYDALRAARPDIILASVRGFDGNASTPGDIVAGTAAAAAVCAALLHHRDTRRRAARRGRRPRLRTQLPGRVRRATPRARRGVGGRPPARASLLRACLAPGRHRGDAGPAVALQPHALPRPPAGAGAGRAQSLRLRRPPGPLGARDRGSGTRGRCREG